MHDDAAFDDLISLSIGYVWNSVLLGLARLLRSHIAYKIDTAKMIAAFYPISYFLHHLIRLNSIVCHVETTRYTMVVFDYRFRYQLTMVEVCILIGLARLLDIDIAYEVAI